jgi:polysaccharide biosynthesis protein PslJ
VHAIDGAGRRSASFSLGALVFLLLVMAAGAANGTYTPTVPVAVVAGTAAILLGERLLRWRNLFVVLLLVILFVPIRKYTLSGAVGFQLEPYRLVVLVILLAWVAALLIDPRVRLRKTGFEAPLLAVIGVTVASILVNTGRIHELGVSSIVTKKLTFFLSFFVITYFVASVIGTRADVDFIIKILVGGGAVLSFFALVEFNTGFNVFDRLQTIFPLLKLQDTGFHSLEVRGGRARVYGSGQHPIAYGAALMMLMPLAIYLARRTRARIWGAAAVLLVLGTLATVSRTGILMLLVVIFIYARMFPAYTKRLWPLVIPALVVVHIALPGSLGTVKEAFFPKGGIIAEQKGAAGTRGSGRVADLGPSLGEASRTPFLGQGYGSRVVDIGPLQNAPILDDQWLETLLETGIVGLAVWVWLYVSFVRRMLRRAREDLDSPEAWLFTGLGAAIAAFAFGLLFYDAYSFIQVTFFSFVLIAIGSMLLQHDAGRRAKERAA